MDDRGLEISHYFEEMRVLFGVVDRTKKEVDRLVAPDFNLFSILWADEVRLSNMIASMLDPTSEHGQGDCFLDAFMDMLHTLPLHEVAKKQVDDSQTGNGLCRQIQEKWKLHPTNIKVAVEQTTNSIAASSRRMDILVNGNDCALMIENKPWAWDQKDQLVDYNEHLSKCFNNHVMVYLSRSGADPTEGSLPQEKMVELKKNGQLIVIGYRPHLIKWLKNCHTKAEADRVRWIIGDFIAWIENNFLISISNEGEQS